MRTPLPIGTRIRITKRDAWIAHRHANGDQNFVEVGTMATVIENGEVHDYVEVDGYKRRPSPRDGSEWKCAITEGMYEVVSMP